MFPKHCILHKDGNSAGSCAMEAFKQVGFISFKSLRETVKIGASLTNIKTDTFHLNVRPLNGSFDHAAWPSVLAIMVSKTGHTPRRSPLSSSTRSYLTKKSTVAFAFANATSSSVPMASTAKPRPTSCHLHVR